MFAESALCRVYFKILIQEVICHADYKCHNQKDLQRRQSVIEAMKHQCVPETDFIFPKDEINVLNGTLKTDGTFTAEMKICENRLNVIYDPSASNNNPKVFLWYINDLLEPEDVLTLQEYIGYCLIPSTKAQKMLFIIGNGGEGKSRLKVLLHEIFGKAIISGQLHNIEDNRFFKCHLQGKLLMIDDDLQNTALKKTGTIKTIVTAETPIDIEEKGKPFREMLAYSRFLCLGNEMPRALYDKSDGFFRRLLIISTKPKDDKRIDDPYLADKLIAEKNEIFAWALEGLQRLIANNYKFTESLKAKLNRQKLSEESCNVPLFLNDKGFVEFGDNYSVGSRNLYNAYRNWCDCNALVALSQNTFISWLKDNACRYHIRYSEHVSAGGRDLRGFKGIKATKNAFYSSI